MQTSLISIATLQPVQSLATCWSTKEATFLSSRRIVKRLIEQTNLPLNLLRLSLPHNPPRLPRNPACSKGANNRLQTVLKSLWRRGVGSIEQGQESSETIRPERI